MKFTTHAIVVAATILGVAAPIVLTTPARGIGDHEAARATTTEVELYRAGTGTTRKCVYVKNTPAGAKRACRTIRATSGVHDVKFCVKVRGKKYCRVVTIDLGPAPEVTDDTGLPGDTELPAAPDDTTGGTAPIEPDPVRAPPYEAPDLSDPTLAGSETDYNLMNQVGADGSGRLDPCTTLTWSVSGTPEQQDLVRRMVHEWGPRVGLATQEMPAPQFVAIADSIPRGKLPRDLGLPTMIVSWVDPSSLPSYFRGSVVGMAKRTTKAGGPAIAVHIALSTDAVNRLPAARSTQLLENLVLHELGHGAGLTHSAAQSQVMFPMVMPDSPARYQRGDLAGLHEVARFRECADL